MYHFTRHLCLACLPALFLTGCATSGLPLGCESPDQNSTLMHRAVECGASSAQIRRLAEDGIDVNARDLFDNTPLHLAGDSETLQTLLALGADATTTNFYNETVLHRAMRDQTAFDAVAIDALLAAGANVNAQDHNGNTALHVAAMDRRWHNNTLTRHLLANGADVNLMNVDGDTPLHLAVKHARQNEFDLEDATWATATFGAALAIRYRNDGLGRSSVNMIKILIAAGAMQDLRNYAAKTPLDIALSEKKSGWVTDALTGRR
jgi:hypothetical protein